MDTEQVCHVLLTLQRLLENTQGWADQALGLGCGAQMLRKSNYRDNYIFHVNFWPNSHNHDNYLTQRFLLHFFQTPYFCR